MRLSEIDYALNLASGMTWAVEVPAASNRGQAVEAFQRLVGINKGDPWCAAFASWVLNTLFPKCGLFNIGGCALIGEWATKHAVLHTTPERGDCFLIWHTIHHPDGSTEHRFGHIGFVLEVLPDGRYVTVEGNAADPKAAATREGNAVYVGRIRTVGEMDRFVRWIDFLNAAAKAA